MDLDNEKTHDLLVMQILDQILNENDANNIKVNHNVFLEGNSGTQHHIDIYWEFMVEGVKHSAIVEVKDSSALISQAVLFRFKSIIDDLSVELRPLGIFVTRGGFQEGARSYAKKNDILLYELKEYTEKGEEDRIKRFNIDMNIYTPHFSNIKFVQDIDWNRKELERLQIPPTEASKIRVEVSDDLKFYDENGTEFTTALVLFNSLVPKGFDELPPTKITYAFDRPTFIQTSNPLVKMKINSLEVTISKTLMIKEIHLKAEDFVDYVLKNVARGARGQRR